MFRPNQVNGTYQRVTGRDVHARPVYSAPMHCPYAVIRLPRMAQKTDKRADSSASRGSADEIVLHHGKILVPTFVDVRIGDRFSANGINYLIAGVEARYTVNGTFDHQEINLEVTPE